MTQYEYLTIPSDDHMQDVVLNDMGRTGWELVSVIFRKHYGYHYIFFFSL